jgi:hypothetical protein
MRTRHTSQTGAVLIHVAIGLIVLIAFSAFAVDYGMMWVARTQAQHAADAGALAGATALAFDDFNDRTVTGPARVAAHTFALDNEVWGEAPDVDIATDIRFYPDEPTAFPAVCSDDSCIRVDAFRNQARGNPLPTWFGNLLGIASQGSRAMAIARVLPANATECLKPWAVADKWLPGPGRGPWTQSSEYDPSLGDSYTPPSPGVDGTGFTNKDANGNPVDYGYQLTLKVFNPSQSNTDGTYVMSSGWTFKLDLPNDSNPEYVNNISNCTSTSVSVAAQDNDCTVEDPAAGCIGVLTGSSTGQDQKGLGGLLGQDSDAYWDRSTGTVVGSNFAASPRIVPVAVFDTALYVSRGYTGTNGIVRVVNILGFFVEGFCDDLSAAAKESYLQCTSTGQSRDIVGRLMTFPGAYVAGAGDPGNAAFGQIISLIR